MEENIKVFLLDYEQSIKKDDLLKLKPLISP